MAAGTRNLTLPVSSGVKPGWSASPVEVVVPGSKRSRSGSGSASRPYVRRSRRTGLENGTRGLRACMLAPLGDHHPARGRVAQQIRAIAPGATPEPTRDGCARVRTPRCRDPDPERQARNRHSRCVALNRREDALCLGRSCGSRPRARRRDESQGKQGAACDRGQGSQHETRTRVAVARRGGTSADPTAAKLVRRFQRWENLAAYAEATLPNQREANDAARPSVVEESVSGFP